MMMDVKLYEKMCLNFPHIPKDVVHRLVLQNHNDEQACLRDLLQVQNGSNKTAFPLPSTPEMSSDLPVSEMNTLNIKDNLNGSDMIYTAPTNASRSSGNRSISDAGIPKNAATNNMSFQPQTAPISSVNYQGFNYAVYIPYATPVYSNNNNIVYNQVLTSMGNSMVLQVPTENFLRSTSPLPDGILPTSDLSPTGASMNTAQAVVNNSLLAQNRSPNIITSQSSPVLGSVPGKTVPTQIPPGTFVLSPTVSPFQTQELPTPVNLNDLPSGDGLSRNMARESSQTSNDVPSVETQLHINIEPNDNHVHDWIPVHSYGSPNYQPLPFQFMHSPLSQASSQRPAGTYQAPELFPADQVPVSLASSVWSSVSVIPTPTVSYGHPIYFPVPTSNAVLIQSPETQKHLHLQRQRLNSLRYELEKMKIQFSKLQEEEEELEQRSQSSARKRDEIAQMKEEISSLNLQCLGFINEVDHYLKGEAPLGEINRDFYSCLNTGQQGPLLPSSQTVHTASPNLKVPARTSSANQGQSAKYPSDEDEENKESSKWKCGKCTFANHPAISVCEICTEPRDVDVQNDCGDSNC